MKIGILASGKGSNFEAIVRHFKGSSLVSVACLCCDQPGARVMDLAKEYQVESRLFPCTQFRTILAPETEKQLADYLLSKSVELVVLAGYMRIVKQPLLHAFQGRIINLHPSLLPSFPGLNAAGQALQYGVKITGCTVHYVDEQVDHGAILAQKPVMIEETDTEDSLLKKIHNEEHLLYPFVIESLALKMKK